MTETKKGFNLFKYVNMGTIIISAFLLLIVVTGTFVGIPLTAMLHDCITRFSRNAILVLAMLPTMRSGAGPNFALPLGIGCGLLAQCIAIEHNFFGLSWLLISMVLAILIAAMVGYGYGKLMNLVKGMEMVAGLFIGFAAVSLMNMIWVSKIFVSEKMVWFLGIGLRTTIALDQVGASFILDRFLSIKIGENISIPTGTLLLVFLLCFLVYLFFRPKPGAVISGDNDKLILARATSLPVDNNRVFANTISMVLGAVGIIVYGQSYGYIQLYDGPMMMALPAAAAILIGGATARRAKVSHVILGAFIFNGILSTSLPVINRLMAGSDATVIADTIRQVLQNGIILYAFMQLKWGEK
jgi:simple sugar transport system permease protein